MPLRVLPKDMELAIVAPSLSSAWTCPVPPKRGVGVVCVEVLLGERRLGAGNQPGGDLGTDEDLPSCHAEGILGTTTEWFRKRLV